MTASDDRPSLAAERLDKPGEAGANRLGRFDLVRSYALLSLGSIAIVSIVSAILLTRLVSGHIIERDSVVSMEFIQSLTQIDDPTPYFEDTENEQHRRRLEEFFRRIIEIPAVLRANVYSRNRTIIWSSDEQQVGHRYDDNPELDRALGGQLVYKLEQTSESEKTEHAELPDGITEFVESYVPIWDQARDNVVGVVEIYRAPAAVFDAVAEGRHLVGATALAGGTFLFATLFWLVRRASRIINRQEARLLETSTLSTVGEMSFAVAHSIRNPLAAMRSSAELTLESSSTDVAHRAASDIVAEVDRLSEWVRELLMFSQFDGDYSAPVALGDILEEVVEGGQRSMQRRGVRLDYQVESSLPRVKGDRSVLGQVFNSIISNAIDSMDGGGRLHVTAKADAGRVQVTVSDTGVGIARSELDKVFDPFFTNKTDGLGLGLPLARRLVRRMGGEITLESELRKGTTVQLDFPAMSS